FRWNAYPISGGCMAAPSDLIRAHPFGQVYNEDYFLFYELVGIGVQSLVLPAALSVRHRHTPRSITLENLQREAIGEIADHALPSAPERERTLDWLAEHWDVWRRSRDSAAADARKLAEWCELSPSAEDNERAPILLALAAWLGQFEGDRRSFADHRRARSIWARALE